MKATKSDIKTSVADIITNIIIEKLEAGCIPWRKPWNGSAAAPKNIVSGKPYRGINALLLGCTGGTWFATFRQIQEKGGNVKTGAKSLPVVYWSMKEVTDSTTGDEKTIPVLRYYRVFSLDDVSGIELPVLPEITRTFSPIEAAERVIENMPQRPEIKIGEARAYYSPSLDYINIPRQESFDSSEKFYQILLHECGHASGHSSRLNRATVTMSAYYGSRDYGIEELVAETCSCFVMADIGLVDATIDNSVAYIQGWLAALKSKDNRGMIIHAAAAGQRAADFILNRREPERS